jgi:hypothetical protein
MTIKSAACLAMVGMIMLSVLLVAGFIRDLVALLQGIIPAMGILTSLVHTLASVTVAIFFYVFYKAQSS